MLGKTVPRTIEMCATCIIVVVGGCFLAMILCGCDYGSRYDNAAVEQFFWEPMSGNLMRQLKTVEVFDFGTDATARRLGKSHSKWRTEAPKATALQGSSAVEFMTTLRACSLREPRLVPTNYRNVTQGAILVSGSAGPFAFISFRVLYEIDTNSRIYWITNSPETGGGQFIRAVELDNLLLPLLQKH